jgi:pimeloyl-ACP methyl ester carboxylesterase
MKTLLGPRAAVEQPASSYRVESGHFEAGGHRLYYEAYGEGDRLLVYTHGLLLDARFNRGIARALADRGHRVVLVDLLGHGRSDKPAHASAYRMDLYVDQVVALLDHLGAEEAVIGGVSLGADVSLMMATHAPERVKGLVIEMPVLEWATPVAALVFVPLLLTLRYGRVLASVLAAGARLLPGSGFDPLDSFVGAVALNPGESAAVLHGLLVGPVAPTFEERAGITVPTLVLSHRADMLHPLNDATNLARQVPNARLVRARSPMELRLLPTRLSAEIATFLDEVWSGEAE